MRKPAAVVVGMVAVLLAGCASPGPSRDEVAERFAIEMATGPGEPEDWQEFADGLADDALDGRCASDVYRNNLGGDPMLLSAWGSTCLMFFEDQMTDSQVEWANEQVVNAVR